MVRLQNPLRLIAFIFILFSKQSVKSENGFLLSAAFLQTFNIFISIIIPRQEACIQIKTFAHSVISEIISTP